MRRRPSVGVGSGRGRPSRERGFGSFSALELLVLLEQLLVLQDTKNPFLGPDVYRPIALRNATMYRDSIASLFMQHVQQKSIT
jgi:hypothetical protein